MPRRARSYVAGLSYHFVQRGNNREASFYGVDGCRYYLELLSLALRRYRVARHAYVLMTNHVHFLMTSANNTGISKGMKVVGSRYAQHMNRTYRRSGTLWEGRHKSSAVESATYLLTCYRCIELNPVTAHMVGRPEEYRWSRYRANAWGDCVDCLTPHPEYLALAADVETQCCRYHELFATHLSDDDLHSIRKSAHYCQPLGSDRFRLQIE